MEEPYIVEFPTETEPEEDNAITLQAAEENQLALSLTTSMVLKKRSSSEYANTTGEPDKREIPRRTK